MALIDDEIPADVQALFEYFTEETGKVVEGAFAGFQVDLSVNQIELRIQVNTLPDGSVVMLNIADPVGHLSATRVLHLQSSMPALRVETDPELNTRLAVHLLTPERKVSKSLLSQAVSILAAGHEAIVASH